MNNKGEVTGIALVWTILMLSNIAISQLPPVKERFQIMKVEQLCPSCDASSMSKAEREHLLRDTIDHPRTDGKDLTNISKIRHL
jgi:hypothetical protein